MQPWTRPNGRETPPITGGSGSSGERLLTDGGQERDDEESEEASPPEDDPDGDEDDGSDGSGENVEVMSAGEAEPAEPKWEKPEIEDVEDIPEVEGPKTRPADWNDADAPTAGKSGGATDGVSAEPAAGSSPPTGGQADDSTAGMPNTARSPGQSRVKEGSADGYVVALELCARLPEDVRLPEEAADLVPVALEAELEQNVAQFAGEQFDNSSPHVDTLKFVDVEGDIWLRIRLGIPPGSFTDLDPDEVREHALTKLEGML